MSKQRAKELDILQYIFSDKPLIYNKGEANGIIKNCLYGDIKKAFYNK